MLPRERPVHIHVEMAFKGVFKAIGPLAFRLNGGGAETYRKWFMKSVAVLEAEVPVVSSG